MSSPASAAMQQLVSVIQRLSHGPRSRVDHGDRASRGARPGASGWRNLRPSGRRLAASTRRRMRSVPCGKGNASPLETCISGWCHVESPAAAVEDIYLDARIPHETYRQTFVKSLVMTPIRTVAPVGAIGVYWAKTGIAPPARRIEAAAERSPTVRPSPSRPPTSSRTSSGKSRRAHGRSRSAQHRVGSVEQGVGSVFLLRRARLALTAHHHRRFHTGAGREYLRLARRVQPETPRAHLHCRKRACIA